MSNDANVTADFQVKQSPRLLEQVRNIIRCKHYSIRTEHSYLDWIKRYIYFHHKQHPEQLDERHISAFLSHLAVNRKVSSSTQNQALCALVFLNRGGKGVQSPGDMLFKAEGKILQ